MSKKYVVSLLQVLGKSPDVVKPPALCYCSVHNDVWPVVFACPLLFKIRNACEQRRVVYANSREIIAACVLCVAEMSVEQTEVPAAHHSAAVMDSYAARPICPALVRTKLLHLYYHEVCTRLTRPPLNGVLTQFPDFMLENFSCFNVLRL